MGKMNDRDFIHVSDYVDPQYPYQAFLGGRGGGKTYGALDYVVQLYKNEGKKSIWTRRTETEMEMIGDVRGKGEGLNPFKQYNKDKGTSYGFVPMNKKIYQIYDRQWSNDGKCTINGEYIGYGVALTAIASIRGIDLTDADYMFFDEFITEKHIRKIKGEGEAILNAIETIGRNRELFGKPPLTVFFMANSNNIYNPLFTVLGVVPLIEKAYKKQERSGFVRDAHIYIKERGLAVHLLKNTQAFEEAKKKTALYKLAKGTDFYDMALGNQFVYNDFSLVEWRDIKGKRPLCSFDDYHVWANSSEAYVTYHVIPRSAKCPHYISKQQQDCKAFRYKFGSFLQDMYLSNRLFFENYDIKEKTLEMLLLN